MNIYVTVTPKYLLVWGATYAIREQISALGGRWSPTDNFWKLPLLDAAIVHTQLNADLTIAKANAIAQARLQAKN